MKRKIKLSYPLPPKETPKRKYEAVWERLKNRETCVLVVEPFMVPRVKKAVIKEKHKDLGFKLLNPHDNFTLSIEYKVKEKQLKFVLKHNGLKDIEV